MKKEYNRKMLTISLWLLGGMVVVWLLFYEYGQYKRALENKDSFEKWSQSVERRLEAEDGLLEEYKESSKVAMHAIEAGLVVEHQKSIIRIYITIIVNVIIAVSMLMHMQKNKELYELAYRDEITGLGNRTFFEEKGKEFLKGKKENAYIMVLDIDKFKMINSQYGHQIGNLVLKEIAKKLEEILKDAFIIARLANDTFAIAMIYEGNISEKAEEIMKAISIVQIEEKKIAIRISLGIYKIEKEDKDIRKALDNATLAKNEVKGNYIKSYCVFRGELKAKFFEESQMETSIQEAMQKKEFKVYYQPKVDAKEEKLIGVEALVRWEREAEVVPPDDFIPLFEKNGFIQILDKYVFQIVCEDFADWKSRYGCLSFNVAVNVSKESLKKENFIEEYSKIAETMQIDKRNIELEITETATMGKDINVLEAFKKIKQAGFTIAIDDFGTGYSSLSMLQDMPIDVMKIDKTFIKKADIHAENQNVIEYIIFIARHLCIKTVIEGVETKEQVDFLKKVGCDIIQGYYYGKPMRKEVFEQKYLLK